MIEGIVEMRGLLNVLCVAGFAALAAGAPSSGGAFDVADAQKALAARGYSVGTIDGVAGPQTRKAIRRFEADNDMPITGSVSSELEALLRKPRVMMPVVTVGASPVVEPIGATMTSHPQPPSSPSHLGETNQLVNRTWVIQDFNSFEEPTGPAFVIFLAANGKVSGPRFAEKMHWRLERNGVVHLTYENAVGLGMERTGRFAAADRIFGQYTEVDGTAWHWQASARPKEDLHRD